MKHKTLLLAFTNLGAIGLLVSTVFIEALHFRHLAHVWKVTNPDQAYSEVGQPSPSIHGRVTGFRPASNPTYVRLSQAGQWQRIPIASDGVYDSGPIQAGEYTLDLVGGRRMIALIVTVKGPTRVNLDLNFSEGMSF